MYGRYRITIAIIGAIGCLAVSLSSSTAAAPKCGGHGEVKCTFAKATRHAKPKACPKGTFLDPRNGGECWSCPKGLKRTVFPVTDKKKACTRPAYRNNRKPKKYKKARLGICPKGQWISLHNLYCYRCAKGWRHDRKFKGSDRRACYKKVPEVWRAAAFVNKLGCPKGQFLDIGKGTCWSCPTGYDRSTLVGVTHKKSCTIRLANICDKGHIAYGPKCFKRGRCGKEGDRPCTLGERVPSCNKGLGEDFDSHTCVKIGKGKSPFLYGLKSLLKNVNTKQKRVCRDNANIYKWAGKLATGKDPNPRCVPYMQAGFACGPMGVAGTLLDAIETGETIMSAEFKVEIDAGKALKDLRAKFASSDCANTLPPEFGFRKATKQKKPPKGLKCEGRAFYDPIEGGTCWTCPAATERSLFESVTSAKACQVPNTTAVAAMCSVAKFVTGEKMDKETWAKKQCVDSLLKKKPWDRIIDETGRKMSQKKICEETGEAIFEVMMKYKLAKSAKKKFEKFRAKPGTGGGNRFTRAIKTKWDKHYKAPPGMPATRFKVRVERSKAIAMAFHNIFSLLSQIDALFAPLVNEASEKFIDALDNEINRSCPDL